MIVTGKRANTLAAELRTDHHAFISGVPTKLGGNDEGMDPHEMLQASLAACTIITVQMYANRKGWPLESTDVSIEIKSENKTETLIERKIKFVGNLDEEQRARLTEIADKCPIHNLLESKVSISTIRE